MKSPFKLREIELLYKDFLTTSCSGKLQDKWNGPYIIQSILEKGTYHIKSMDVQDSEVRRAYGNRLKIYALPKIQWSATNTRNVSQTLDKEAESLPQ